MKVAFTRRRPFESPSFGDYYIQERKSGKNIYGHDSYEYSLFRRVPFETVATFRTRKQAYKYVSERTFFSKWSTDHHAPGTIKDRDYVGCIHGSVMYRVEKKTRPVQVRMRPVDDEQVLGWFWTYNECLAAAKEYIEREVLHE